MSSTVDAPSSSLRDTSNESTTINSFIDYVPPPVAKLQPPAKYKLWLLVMVLVYFAEWLSAEANFLGRLQASGLSPNASLFFMLAIIVFCLVFSTLDLVVALLTVKIRGRSYGLGPWLKQPRMKWAHKSNSNFFVECVASLVRILEDGFAMFNAPAATAKLVLDPTEEEAKEYECKNGSDCDVVLRVERRIDPKKLKQYNEWCYRIDKASSRGLKNVEKTGIVEETWDEEQGRTVSDSVSSGRLQVVLLTFSHVDYLNEWMMSNKRRKLIKELQPLLMEPDIIKIQNARALPDAFTDLLTRQGDGVPILVPKKWKVWWLTLLGLFFTQLWTGATLPYYFDKWGLNDVHTRIRAFVGVSIGTFLNSFVMTPLMLFLFSNWMQRKECENDTIEPWRTLNDGIHSIWIKVLMSFGLYGGCAIAWAVKGSNST